MRKGSPTPASGPGAPRLSEGPQPRPGELRFRSLGWANEGAAFAAHTAMLAVTIASLIYLTKEAPSETFRLITMRLRQLQERNPRKCVDLNNCCCHRARLRPVPLKSSGCRPKCALPLMPVFEGPSRAQRLAKSTINVSGRPTIKCYSQLPSSGRAASVCRGQRGYELRVAPGYQTCPTNLSISMQNGSSICWPWLGLSTH